MTFNFKRVGIVLAIAIPVVTFPVWYLRLFPLAQARCVITSNGTVQKAYNDDCLHQEPGSQAISIK